MNKTKYKIICSKENPFIPDKDSPCFYVEHKEGREINNGRNIKNFTCDICGTIWTDNQESTADSIEKILKNEN